MGQPWEFKTANKNQILADAFDTSSGHRHDGTDSRVTKYYTKAVGTQSTTVASASVTLASIAATDIVVATPIYCGTAAYITTIAITASTGFLATFNTTPGNATISYAVFSAT
jgi:hypothetical protein